MLHPRSTDLASRLRTADSFLAIASVLITELERWGFAGIAVIAHDAHGNPGVWAGNAFVSRARARAYVAHEHRDDPALAVVRASHRPALASHGASWTWVVPLVGCGDLLGTLRLSGCDHTVCIDELAGTGAMVSVRLAQLGLEAPLAHSVRTNLTPRQHEVVYLVARGFTNAEIGDMLAISSDAVKKHISRALDVLGLSNRTELAAVASRWSADSGSTHAPPAVVIDLGRERSTTDEGRWFLR